MSSSGALLPTISQEDSSGRPHEHPTQPSSSEGKAPICSSPVSSSLASPSINLSMKNEGTGDEHNSSPSHELPCQNENCSNDIDSGQSNVSFLPSTNQQGQPKSETVEAEIVTEASSVTPSNVSREWSTTYSDMFQDEGGGDGLASEESDDDVGTGTPPGVLWARSIRNLLEDEIGHNVFRNYMEKELGSAHMLYFWYACKGLRLGEYEGDIKDTIEVIWKHFIKNKTVGVSSHTYKIIEDDIKHQKFVSDIFSRAQIEVENRMRDTVYRAFLKSEDYIRYLEPIRKDEMELSCSQNYLPTLHENSEFHADQKQTSRLTFNNLRASANYRVGIERIKPEANAGCYLRDSSSYKMSPYHIKYVSGHAVSLVDSELQSLSSGAHTDDTRSYTDSSVDRSSFTMNHPASRKDVRRHNQKIRENAQLNKEPPGMSSLSGINVIPRTMIPGQNKGRLATENPNEFSRLLAEKLDGYQQERDRKIRLHQSIFKVTQSEDAPEEARREHAVNALPPNVLMDRLMEEKVQLDDLDPSQILDEHVARVWDSPGLSPSSPKQKLGGTPNVTTPPLQQPNYKSLKNSVMRQFPHLSYPQPMSPSVISNHTSKCSLRGIRHKSGPPTSSMAYANAPNHPHMDPRYKGPSSGQAYAIHHSCIPQSYVSKTVHYARRRERRLDVNSTFSSDSGNVADCPETQDSNIKGKHLPKSKSVPEYMESQAVGSISDVVSSGLRRQQFGSGAVRRSSRKPQPDFTDSGVSVISDSGRSGAPSTSSERVESWLFQSRPFSCGDSGSLSVYPGGVDRAIAKDLQQKYKGGCKSTHTAAGSTSPGMLRRCADSSGSRSQCSSSTSATTCINTRPEMSSPTTSIVPLRPPEMSRDSPLGQAQPSNTSDRRKFRAGSSSCSTKSTCQSSSFCDGPGYDGSTSKNVQSSSKQSCEGVSAHSAPSTPSDVTMIVYTFHGDNVPFIIKVPSRPVTLKRFKMHLHKKGSYRYFFKKFCEDIGTVNEEITDDAEVLPFFEGKVFVQIHTED